MHMARRPFDGAGKVFGHFAQSRCGIKRLVLQAGNCEMPDHDEQQGCNYNCRSAVRQHDQNDPENGRNDRQYGLQDFNTGF